MNNKLRIIIGILIFPCFIFSNIYLKTENSGKKETVTNSEAGELVVYSYNCFQVGYFIKNNEIFYYDGVESKKVPKSDIKTFKQIHSSIGRDKKNVYSGAEVIKGLDIKTLVIYSDVLELEETEPKIGCYPVIDILLKDKNGIYTIGRTPSGKPKLKKIENF
ncbi:DKNYY domain-containing protein [Sebaldella termitidis]|uniref:DKNYY domain-containing protein n=1 Tax=Sebaldella termitidis TaxID=826 RepID=UPI003EBEB1D5